ncbi:cathepsin K-like [Branchiostoma lanceolatum]|uniref:cathepsin K-like n=1 Tax=Branchiostoma lanceolatum TaxID=7740 RepID=UPI0034532B1F
MAISVLTLCRLIVFTSFVFISAKRITSNDIFGITEKTDRDRQWEVWKFWHGKTYPSAEEEIYRRKIWENNLAAIFKHNAAGKSYKMAMNSFGDQERTHRTDVLSYRTNRVDESDSLHRTVAMGMTQPPPSLDWREKGVVTPVKNQGMLGKVMAYAITESLESFHAIQTGNLIQLSTREVADCCPDVDLAVGYDCVINKTKGLCSAADYPSQPPGQCNAHLCSAAATCKNTVHVIPNHETVDMVHAVSTTPVVVIVDASLTSFQLYASGIYDDPACSTTRLDHALVVVGYGSFAGKDYWICRNSWGTAWGESGYIRIARGKNMCGIAERVFYPA